MQPLLPPSRLAPDGTPRRVGVEIEFAGLRGAEVAALLCRLFGGFAVELDPHRFAARGTRLGDFTVELDVRLAHATAGEDCGGGAFRTVRDNVRHAFGAVASLLMPFEVVTPPLPIERLADLDELVAALRRSGARGTGRSPLYAFGLHLNPQVAAFDADYVLDHLKAFMLLAPRLRAEIAVDLSRRLSPFIEPYPEAYVRRVLAPGYRPPIERLIDDYVDANPTRNRELDLMPLFVTIDEARVRRRVADPRVKPRPTFHYRLPNSRVDDPDWSIVADWNRWVAVERLAADRARLDELARDAAGAPAAGAWTGRIREWLA